MLKTWEYFAKFLGNNYTLFVSVTGACLCLFSGMSMAWSSPVLEKLKGTKDNPLGNPITDEENDLIGSLFSIGGAIGPISLIYALDLLGRKFTMAILAAIFPIFHLILALSGNIYMYYISRIALGVAVGGSFSIVAVYISEIASAKMRGTYLSLGTCFILTGCFITYCLGPYISIFFFNLFIAVGSFIYLPLFVLSCPESLYYTMQKYGPEKTMEILKKLRKNGEEIKELEEIKTQVENEEHGSFSDIFLSRIGRKAFFICTSLLIIQQFCGITILITYSQTIFKDANVSIAPELCTIIVSAVQTLTCLVTPPVVGKFDRKKLLYFSFAGSGFSNILLGLYFSIDSIHKFQWIPLVALISFVCFYNFGAGPIPWIILGELYPLKVKSLGTALSNTIFWLFQFVLTYFFNKIDIGVAFLGFSGVCLFAVAFVLIFLIETRGKTLQEIQKEMST